MYESLIPKKFISSHSGSFNTPKEYLTIIPRACTGYEMIDSQRGATRLVGCNHLLSNKREWNNCFIKNVKLNY